jgi:hypothetical protein
MDPYLEAHWLDVHTSLVTSARDALNESLPEDLVASAEERIAVESQSGEDSILGPDVRVFEPPATTTVVAETPAGWVEAPYRLTAQVEPMVERFLRIVEAGTERLITVIEVVSPTNKRGDGLRAFRAKRADVLRSGVSFVEIDLNRAGDWRALLRPHRCPAAAVSPYRVTFRVPADPDATYLHPIRLRDALPSIAVPLRQTDPRVQLDLQALIEHAYGSGRYERRIDYTKPCDPPLEGEDAAWADERLHSAGKRSAQRG